MIFERDRALIIDTETTGFDKPEAIEIAFLAPGIAINLEDVWCKRYKPSKQIESDALAAHHIFEWELDDCPPTGTFELPKGTDYIIGHAVDFDWEVLGKPKVQRICTLAMARYLWPDFGSHKLGAMVYELFLNNYRAEGKENELRDLLRGAHGAKTDVILVAMILDRMMEDALPGHIKTLHDLWLFSEMARIPTKMTFGKHKGELIKDIPYSYKTWLLRQEDVDPYLRAALLGKDHAED